MLVVISKLIVNKGILQCSHLLELSTLGLPHSYIWNLSLIKDVELLFDVHSYEVNTTNSHTITPLKQ